MIDKLGNRMKTYENLDTSRFMPLIPICARLDGKSFSKFCKGLDRPFDKTFRDVMIETTMHLVKETNACIGYTQSDEITLIFYSDNLKSQIFHDGRKQKMISVLASMCSTKFNILVQQTTSETWKKQRSISPLFDCRVWAVPTLMEAINVLKWREFDATKNSVTMAASMFYSDKELFKKHECQQQEMLFQKGVNWNDYPSYFKRGTYVQRVKCERKFTTDEIEKLPPKHNARTNPNLTIERTDFVKLDMPPITQVTNIIDVVFNGAKPITKCDAPQP